MLKEGVRLVYNSGKEGFFEKPGYYNLSQVIRNISISSKWSVVLFTNVNCTGHYRICERNMVLSTFHVKSIYVCEKHLSSLDYGKNIKAQPFDPTNIYELSKKAVVSLTANKGGDISVFSGFFSKIVETEGFITGYITTVYHGVENADSIFVIIELNNKYYVRKATVVGTDIYGDIAVVSVVGISANQTYLQWGNSRETIIGSPVCNIGYPLGIDYASLSVGIVRDNVFVHGMGGVESLCTDVAIYTGCSGSPIIDTDSKVIGIVSYGAAGGINWGMSQYLLEHVVDTIIKKNANFDNGYIGISWRELTPEFLFSNNLHNEIALEGVLVASVDDIQGVIVNDIILSVNKVPMGMHQNRFSISSVSWFLKPGESIDVVFLSAIDNYKHKRVKTIVLREFTNLKWASSNLFHVQK